ncbi:uncharacterized protein LOC131637516 [Vicia villosa]|uniref:uncharacterized protein LOC131637516 n=1 Tax=Vicia villosa TaxID=3911 RepID=UPI00273CB1D6|nr:uncharacterized protein LOC131637516 [Vicia villosa]
MENIRVSLKFEACLTVKIEGRSGSLAVLWRNSAVCSVLNFTRCQFTWVKSRGSEHMIEERLDQAFTAPQWLNLFPTVSFTNLIACHLDHSPILLSCKTLQTLRRDVKFRFKNSWLQENDIESLEVWSRRKRNSRKGDLGKNLEVMEMFREGRDKYSSNRFFKAHTEYNQVLIREDAYWKQRAKMHWLRDGDMNTKFFHQSATARNKFKKI